MNLLVLGGTRFLGRHVVEAALARQHRVTLFNRGHTNPALFPALEHLRGSREDLTALRGRTWDAVVDTSGYVPRLVRSSAELLSGAVGHYTFISSISVYADFSKTGMDETAPIGKLEDETTEQVNAETYGPLKGLCERAVEEVMGSRALVVRPGLLAGPHDPTDRLTYWPVRIAQGGHVLAPNPPSQRIQFIDARDLADWIVRMAESGRAGTFNATGPDYALTLEALLETAKHVSGSDARIVWVDEAFLKEHGVRYWIDLPAVVPQADASDSRGMQLISCARAIGAGLRFRPVATTVRDTLQWARAARPPEVPLRAGLSREREAGLLRAWLSRR